MSLIGARFLLGEALLDWLGPRSKQEGDRIEPEWRHEIFDVSDEDSTDISDALQHRLSDR